MEKFFIKKIVPLFIGVLLIGCGSSSSDDTTLSSSKIEKGTGYYLDSGIEGIKYSCADNLISGVTLKNGQFTLVKGSICKFYLNKIEIRKVSNTFDGIKIFETNITTARLLQSLDIDGNLSNGITITSKVANEINDKLPISDEEVKQLVELLKNKIPEYKGKFISLQEAQEHLTNTIESHRPKAKDINISLKENSSIKIELKGEDPQNDPLKYIITHSPSNGTLKGTPPNIEYIPNKDFYGKDTFQYKVSDGSLDSKEANVNIEIIPIAPIANNDSITTQEDNSILIDILANDTHTENQTLQIIVTQHPLHGNIKIENNKVLYTPITNFNGKDTFKYKIDNKIATSNEAIVTINILPVNDAPIASNVTAQATNGIKKDIILKATDVDNDKLTYSIIQNPINGTISLNGNIASYTPNRDFNGTDTFKYQVSDGKLTSNAIVTIYVTNKYIFVGDNEYEVIELGNNSISKTIKINPNTSRSLYIIFTNSDSETNATVTISTDLPQQNSSETLLRESIFNQTLQDNNVPEYITLFNNKDLPPKDSTITTREEIITPLKEENEGDTAVFYTSWHDDQPINVTLKKVVSNVDTAFGPKTLKIWVADNVFGDCNKSKCLTQSMVDEMADAFLKDGYGNDIYDWVTNIFGEEWGEHSSSALIPDNDEINILLLDIGEDDSPYGGVLGYFWAKDNYTKASGVDGSNERVMFYIDAIMYANRGDDGTNEFWKIRLHSTLAHELQHMINYYQRNVKRGISSEIWFNEMLSVATQDALATKIGDTAVRGIDPSDGTAGEPGITDGRFPAFNSNNDESLSNWVGGYSYSLVGSFGAFIIRNYGGVKVLGDMQHFDSNSAVESIVGGVNENGGNGKSFKDLLKEWGIGVMLSDYDDLPQNYPRYNFGDFLYVELNNIRYDLGSINFFNYNPLPKFHTTGGIVKPHANYYYKLGDNLTGEIDINISFPSIVEATLITK